MNRFNLQPRFKDSPHFKDFWTKGNGKQLIRFSGAEVSFKDFEKFSPYFYHIDEAGDQVVKDIYLTKNFTRHQEKLKATFVTEFLKVMKFPKVQKNCFYKHKKFLTGWIMTY
ncbi:hypothetical protein [Chryseobacterium sp. POE27]|uniref:hypothetical protein n=1 Tax=Chryseobacterium sp. POE27 TaxID=3138177 RepID=UPI00321BA227